MGSWSFVPLGEGGLLIAGEARQPGMAIPLRNLAQHLRALALPGVTDYVPTTETLLVCFDPLAVSVERLIAQIDLIEPIHAQTSTPPRIVPVLVQYGAANGPDLLSVAATTGLRPEQVVAEHTRLPMPVDQIGFMPGFPYIGGLPAVLRLPRRVSPRVAVPGGSVAIAQGWSGIYPHSAPGGWHLIGRTDAVLFDPRRDPPALLAPGDYVQFIAADD